MSRKSKRVDYREQFLGPQVVGGTYRSGYWGITYEVVEVTIGLDGDIFQTDRDLDGHNLGRERSHRTPWDRRDSVVTLPVSPAWLYPGQPSVATTARVAYRDGSRPVPARPGWIYS